MRVNAFSIPLSLFGCPVEASNIGIYYCKNEVTIYVPVNVDTATPRKCLVAWLKGYVFPERELTEG